MFWFDVQVKIDIFQFLVVEGVDLQTHFEKLAQRFPLQTFEKSMGDFIQMILDSMDIPALDKVVAQCTFAGFGLINTVSSTSKV